MANLGEILEKKELAKDIKLIKVSAPLIAAKAKAGQFIILRIDEQGERVPLTIADSSASLGTLTLIFQEVGKSTMHLGTLTEGDCLADIIGPLGHPTHIENFGTVVTIGGGVGTAVIYPVTKALKEAGNKIISIVGARSKEMLILEKEMRETSDELYITTDNGSYGHHGFVTDELKRLIDEGERIDLVFAIGPCVMMKAVSNLTKQHNLKTIVSLNSIMVDGTGMCGGCRVTVGNETKFVCVDGP
ncbi:sulfide/dihydroorotate dehydrogenase-like FAD/NAD-binding protein, partial [bacterium]|nr:sulfide/dihydroorotate dehydrogenase-like FAD/NAD-binding protein [bacterium]